MPSPVRIPGRFTEAGAVGREESPEELARAAGGEGKVDASADLEQPEAQCVELHSRDAEPGEPAAKGVEQPVGGTQQRAELVGLEAVPADSASRRAGSRCDPPGDTCFRACLDQPDSGRSRRRPDWPGR